MKWHRVTSTTITASAFIAHSTGLACMKGLYKSCRTMASTEWLCPEARMVQLIRQQLNQPAALHPASYHTPTKLGGSKRGGLVLTL